VPSRAAVQLVRSSMEPLYRQLAADLERDIAAGVLPPGAKLPSEPELMQQFGVSRVTVRQAIALLQRSGKVMARRGKGTFVLQRVVSHELDGVRGFYESLRRQGIEPQTELIEFSPDAGARDAERAPDVDLPVRLKRLYSLNGKPFALVIGYMPERAAGLTPEDAHRLKVYEILEQRLGVQVERADVVIRCERPPVHARSLLGLPVNALTLVMERTSYSDGVACEFMRIFILPQRYEFRMRVPGAINLAGSVHEVEAGSARTRTGTR
jgi:GntR family transcriptional regulator